MRGKDKKVVRVVEEMKKAEVRILKKNEWEIERDLVLKKEKIYILKNKRLRIEVVWLYHNILVAKYKDRWKTIELATRNYQWPEVTKNIEKYIKRCDLCQRMKNSIVTINVSWIQHELGSRVMIT